MDALRLLGVQVLLRAIMDLIRLMPQIMQAVRAFFRRLVGGVRAGLAAAFTPPSRLAAAPAQVKVSTEDVDQLYRELMPEAAAEDARRARARQAAPAPGVGAAPRKRCDEALERRRREEREHDASLTPRRRDQSRSQENHRRRQAPQRRREAAPEPVLPTLSL